MNAKQGSYASLCCTYGKRELQKLRQGSMGGRLCPQEDERSREKLYLASVSGLPKENVFFLKQRHSNKIVAISQASIEANKQNIFYSEGDALYTQIPQLMLVIRTADCLPLFVIIEIQEQAAMIGLIHAGWQGLKKSIVFYSILEMLRALQNTHSDLSALKIHVLGGPYATPAVYEVGREFRNFFPSSVLYQKKGRLFLDLLKEAKRQLQAALEARCGLCQSQLFSCQWDFYSDLEACTISQNEGFFSHRCQDKGRNLNTLQLQAAYVPA